MKLLADMTEPELREYLTRLARDVEGMLPPGPSAKGTCLFALLLFDESKVGELVSNATRPVLIRILREAADSVELRLDITH